MSDAVAERDLEVHGWYPCGSCGKRLGLSVDKCDGCGCFNTTIDAMVETGNLTTLQMLRYGRALRRIRDAGKNGGSRQRLVEIARDALAYDHFEEASL